MIDIPMNDNIKNETAEFDRVVKTALDDIRNKGECWINSNSNGYDRGNCCGERTAQKVVREFLAKGYHARRNLNLVGRWIGFTISKKELSAGRNSEILG